MSNSDRANSLGGPPPRWEGLALASARVPFRLKVAVVRVAIFAVLAMFFAIVGFDTKWMKDNFSFIAGGLKYTLYMAVGGIVLAVILAGLGALGRISSNPIAYGVSPSSNVGSRRVFPRAMYAPRPCA